MIKCFLYANRSLDYLDLMQCAVDKSIRGFCVSGHVRGPVIRHIPSLVPSVSVIPMGRHRLVCDGPRLWQPVEVCLDCFIDKSIHVYVGVVISGGPVIYHILVPSVLYCTDGYKQASM